jgi:hypothetical protein
VTDERTIELLRDLVALHAREGSRGIDRLDRQMEVLEGQLGRRIERLEGHHDTLEGLYHEHLGKPHPNAVGRTEFYGVLITVIGLIIGIGAFA